MTHVHWDGLSGGLMLKYYGWDLIGGPDGLLGYRFDHFPRVTKVPIHGNALPKLPHNASFYVYTGDETSFKERAWKDFLHKDLEDFFGKKSNIGESQSSLMDKLFPKAAAHTGHDHSASDPIDLQQINNLLGNVVIFVQKEKPSDSTIRDHFNRLEPLTTSTCGG